MSQPGPEFQTALDDLVIAGSICAEILFRHAQRLPATEHDQLTCKAAFETWDRALTRLKLQRRKLAPNPAP